MRIDTFLWVLTFCEQLLTFFQEESQPIRDERKDHGTVDESSSEQQIRESGDYTLIVRKIWSSTPSATALLMQLKAAVLVKVSQN